MPLPKNFFAMDRTSAHEEVVRSRSVDYAARPDRRPTGGLILHHHAQPEGEDHPCRGVYLEVVENEHLVFTDAFINAWEPSTKPFMVATLTFENIGTADRPRTRYTAHVQHWSAADREAHENMGFHPGWGQCADQLAALVATL